MDEELERDMPECDYAYMDIDELEEWAETDVMALKELRRRQAQAHEEI